MLFSVVCKIKIFKLLKKINVYILTGDQMILIIFKVKRFKYKLKPVNGYIADFKLSNGSVSDAVLVHSFKVSFF